MTLPDGIALAAQSEVALEGAAYLDERIAPHPILGDAAHRGTWLVTGGPAIGLWDETSPLSLRLITPEPLHRELGLRLRAAGLLNPPSDALLRLRDEEAFHRYPSVRLLILTTDQVDSELRLDPIISLWTYLHAAVVEDEKRWLERRLKLARESFAEKLANLQQQHYFRFRQARIDSSAGLTPRRASTLRLLQLSDAVRCALQLCFLANARPYPYDRWLEQMAERETPQGAHVVDAVRALTSAQDEESRERASKVLRDRVQLALQQARLPAEWIEEWSLWPYSARAGEGAVLHDGGS